MRPIDVDALKEKFEDILDRTYTDDYAKGFVAGLYAALNMPTLTPPNESMEALKAINNAAVAYIEGGPYENDIPGLELAMEIDRLSQDFVRPPEELEKLGGLL